MEVKVAARKSAQHRHQHHRHAMERQGWELPGREQCSFGMSVHRGISTASLGRRPTTSATLPRAEMISRLWSFVKRSPNMSVITPNVSDV
ncbi:hypothetical protein E2C01_006645 [Portunus trituberculatus]|uniref:Uncharacterized protein n=1 Tax=Portunus trituberculatus TaxID=210409 RepID=A0A5B7D084_PORTR|nr:hypothetical protein [Portunus trituberculatus]